MLHEIRTLDGDMQMLVYENYNKFGNTVSSSIPIALKEASKFNLIKNNDNIILSGFGVGLSWASVLIKWKKIN